MSEPNLRGNEELTRAGEEGLRGTGPGGRCMSQQGGEQAVPWFICRWHDVGSGEWIRRVGGDGEEGPGQYLISA